MAHQATATKKRPQTFDELVGQSFVVSTIKNSIQQGRIAPAYLFSGPRGVGKTSAARLLAKALNCPDGPSADGCPDFSGSAEIAAGRAIDVIEIDGASNTSVNDVRQIKDEVMFPPTEARYKIYIIDEVHMLSHSAFNALLKTIEEPPPYVVFVFATTEVHKVPATIRSRCQQFAFRLIDADTVVDLLRTAVAELGHDADDDALEWIARESGGSLRDAYTLVDQVVAASGERLTLAAMQAQLGLVSSDRLAAMVEQVADGNVQAALALIDDILAAGVHVQRLSSDLADLYRGLVLRSHGVQRLRLIGPVAASIPAATLDRYSADALESCTIVALGLYRDLRYTVNPRFDVELAIARMAAIVRRVEPDDLVRRVEALTDRIVATAATERSDLSDERTEDTEPVPATPRTVSADLAPDRLEAILQAFRRDRAALAALLAAATNWRLDGTTLSFGFSDAFAGAKVASERELIAGVARDVLGVPDLSVQIETYTEASPPDGSQPPDDDVARVVRVFRGKVGEESE